MEYRFIGNTKIKVSRLCFGTLPMSPLQLNIPAKEGGKVVRYALEKGINFIDTAEIYGSYPHVKEALKGFGKDVVIATKTKAVNKTEMETSFKKAVDEIGKEYMDIFLLHLVRNEEDFKSKIEALKHMIKLKEKGYIRAVGASVHSSKMADYLSKIPEIDIIHPMANKKNIGIVDPEYINTEKLLAMLNKRGKGVYTMKPLAGGHFYNDVKKALEYLTKIDSIHSVAVGMENKLEVDINTAIFNGETVDQKLLAEAEKEKKIFVIKNVCVGCGICVEECGNNALKITNNKAVIENKLCVMCGYCRRKCPKFALRII